MVWLAWTDRAGKEIPLDETLRKILADAASAPSGDNTQPVRFAVDPRSRTIGLSVDPARDPSPMNAGQRMARLAAGASLENLVRSAEARGFGVAIEPGEGDTLAVVRLSGREESAPRDPALSARSTNRRHYDGRPVPADVLGRLAGATPDLDGASTHWIVGADRLDAFAGLIGEADAAMFGESSMRDAFLAKVRFDRPPGAEVEEGLPIGSLEVGTADRLALRTMRRTPDWILQIAGARRVFAEKARTLIVSSSGLCLVVAPDGSPASDLAAGRALQRAWLAIGSEGLSTQPMMSLLVLENAVDNGGIALREALGHARLESLRRRFRDLAPEIAGRRPAWLQRFGHAPPPTARAGRLPIDAVAGEIARP